jgi:NADPH-dependent 2,4-dienoyl-CoA reductase/sulfur reductase-like enzyme
MQADVLIVGSGPAGIAAACVAAEAGVSVLLVDDNPAPGGQIWRRSEDADANRWIARLHASGAQIRNGTRVLGPANTQTLLAEDDTGPFFITWRKLVLCTGARELLLPFPGWTLPGVTGAGGLQALVQGGLPINGHRVVVAGSGPLLLAVAAHLREHGARIEAIAEQSWPFNLARFAARLPFSKLLQGWRLSSQLRGVPLLTEAWPIEAEGDRRLHSVRLRTRSGTRRFECDYLACGFGLVPNIELPLLIGCSLNAGFVAVDSLQRTSVPDVLCAGEPTGIGGLERSLIEGEIAGHVAAGAPARATPLYAQRQRLNRFSARLATAFALRDDLRQACQPDTIVCRCEDVTWQRISAYSDWRSAKLHTRCGMGACQGRVCGAAVRFLTGRSTHDHPRPPLFPASMATLATEKESDHG